MLSANAFPLFEGAVAMQSWSAHVGSKPNFSEMPHGEQFINELSLQSPPKWDVFLWSGESCKQEVIPGIFLFFLFIFLVRTDPPQK